MITAFQVLNDAGLQGMTLQELSDSEASVEIRQQPTKGSWPRQSPDTYVTVQVVPHGVTPLTTLNHSHAKRRGIQLVYCGEGYRNRQETIRSSLGSALNIAKNIADTVNAI